MKNLIILAVILLALAGGLVYHEVKQNERIAFLECYVKVQDQVDAAQNEACQALMENGIKDRALINALLVKVGLAKKATVHGRFTPDGFPEKTNLYQL